MPSLIGVTVNGVSVAQNYRTQQVPFSRFGTRKVIWFSIGHVDTRTEDYTLDNVKMNTMIDAIQTRGEVAIVGAPTLGNNWGRFTVGVFEDTFNNGADTSAQTAEGGVGYNSMSSTLQTALEDALVDGDVSVTQVYLFGGYSNNQPGWSDSDAQQEYATRAEYNAHSYLNPLDL